jgi:hypothetical protein
MSATAKLDDYLKQFRVNFKAKEWDECSVDTEMLLNDSISIGSEISSRYSKSRKSKPLRSTSTKTLKPIKEEEDAQAVMYDINDYLPSRTHITTHKSGALTSRNSKETKLDRLHRLDTSKISVALSEDTEALLASSDEEMNSRHKGFMKTSRYKREEIKPAVRNHLKLNEEITTSRVNPVQEYGHLRSSSTKSSVAKECATPCFSFTMSKSSKARTSSMSLDKENSLKLDHLKQSPHKSPKYQVPLPGPYLKKPPLNLKEERLKLEICTCIIKGIKKAHLKTCKAVIIDAILPNPAIKPRKKLGLLDSIILIQRTFRKYLQSKSNLRASQLITARRSSRSPLRKSSARLHPGITSYHRSDEQAFLNTKRSIINPSFTLTDSGVSHNPGSNSSSAMTIQELFSPKLNTLRSVNSAVKKLGKWVPPARMESSHSSEALNSFNLSLSRYYSMLRWYSYSGLVASRATFSPVKNPTPSRNARYLGILKALTENSSTMISEAAIYIKVPQLRDRKIACTNTLCPASSIPAATPIGDARTNIQRIIRAFFLGCWARERLSARQAGILCIPTPMARLRRPVPDS